MDSSVLSQSLSGCGESVTQVRVVRRGRNNGEILVRRWSVLRLELDEFGNDALRIRDSQLREQELEFFVVSLCEVALHFRRQAPDLFLERTDRLLSSLIEELLVRIARLALVLGVFPQPRVHIISERAGEMIVQHRLEIRREMNLAGLGLRKIVERFVRQCRCAMLYRACETVVLSRVFR